MPAITTERKATVRSTKLSPSTKTRTIGSHLSITSMKSMLGRGTADEDLAVLAGEGGGDDLAAQVPHRAHRLVREGSAPMPTLTTVRSRSG